MSPNEKPIGERPLNESELDQLREYVIEEINNVRKEYGKNAIPHNDPEKHSTQPLADRAKVNNDEQAKLGYSGHFGSKQKHINNLTKAREKEIADEGLTGYEAALKLAEGGVSMGEASHVLDTERLLTSKFEKDAPSQDPLKNLARLIVRGGKKDMAENGGNKAHDIKGFEMSETGHRDAILVENIANAYVDVQAMVKYEENDKGETIPKHSVAVTWVGVANDMKAFVNPEKTEYKIPTEEQKQEAQKPAVAATEAVSKDAKKAAVATEKKEAETAKEPEKKLKKKSKSNKDAKKAAVTTEEKETETAKEPEKKLKKKSKSNKDAKKAAVATEEKKAAPEKKDQKKFNSILAKWQDRDSLSSEGIVSATDLTKKQASQFKKADSEISQEIVESNKEPRRT